jgi:hypothetical protein
LVFYVSEKRDAPTSYGEIGMHLAYPTALRYLYCSRMYDGDPLRGIGIFVFFDPDDGM